MAAVKMIRDQKTRRIERRGDQELRGLEVGGDEVGDHTEDGTRKEEWSTAHGRRQRRGRRR